MDDFVYVGLGVLFAAVIVEGLVLLGVMRQLGSVLLTVQPAAPREIGGGPEVGAPVELEAIGVDRGAVFAFVSPNCEPCDALTPALADLADEYPAVSVLPIVAFGSDEDRRRYAQRLDGLARLDLADLYEEWHVPGTPYAVSVDRVGRIRAKGIVTTREQLTTMAELAQREPEAAAPAGDGIEMVGAGTSSQGGGS